MAIDKELLDQLLSGRDPQDLFAKDGLIAELKKALSERMLAAECQSAFNRDPLSARKRDPLVELVGG